MKVDVVSQPTYSSITFNRSASSACVQHNPHSKYSTKTKTDCCSSTSQSYAEENNILDEIGLALVSLERLCYFNFKTNIICIWRAMTPGREAPTWRHFSVTTQ